MNPARVALLLAFISGLAFLFTTPPLRFPDGGGHFLRAASVAEGWFFDRNAPADAVRLPRAVAADVDYFTARRPEVTDGKPFGLSEITSRIGVLTGADAELIDRKALGGQMVYHGVGYLPQALAFATARVANLSFVPTLWSMRFAGLLVSVLITALALVLMPSWARWTSAAVSLVPMAAYLRGSAAPDAVIAAIVLVAVAALLRGAERVPLRPAIVAVLAITCLFLAVVKPPYLCVLLIGLLWLRAAPLGSPRSTMRIATLGLIGIMSLAAAAWHAADVASFTSDIRPDLASADYASADKLQTLTSAPGEVTSVFVNTLFRAPERAYSIIARFGWADIRPHPLLPWAVIAWGASIIYLDRRAIAQKTSPAYGIVLLATFVVQLVAVLLSIWLFFSETNAGTVQSIQGRHLLPLLVCGALGFAVLITRRAAGGAEVKPNLMLPRVVAIGAALLLIASLGFSVAGEYFGVTGFSPT